MAEDKKVSDLSNPDRRNWGLHRRENTNIYSLALIHKDRSDQATKDLLSRVLGRQATEFQFRVNPKSMDLDEPAAVTIRPTQGGGQFVEHQGQIYKNINITGTTGLRPNRRRGGLQSVNIDNRGLPSEERTGFDDLIELRNLFRAYNMAKVDNSLAPNVLMIWKNGKEGDYFVVEPLNFRTNRDASSPLTANYTITLKTIKKLDDEMIPKVKDSYLSRKSARKQRSRVNAAIQGLAESINTLNNRQDTFLNSVASGVSDILTPSNNLLQGLANFVNTQRRILEIPRVTLSNLSDNITDAINSVSALAISYTSLGQRDDYSQIASALRTLRRAVLGVLSEDALFAVDPSTKINTKRLQYIDSVFGKRDSGGDPLDIANEPYGSDVAQATVGSNDNIRKLAKRLLGSASRWKSLVIANDLKAPYISADGDGIDVLRPGDNLIYPVIGTASQTSVGAETVGKRRTLTPIEERLGRDIKISSPTSAGGITQYDIVVEEGDMGTVEGKANLNQAVNIKFETEQGELPLHPFFGIKYPLGVKAPAADNFIEFDVNARATLLSDLRIGRVNSLDIGFEGNTLDVRGDVDIKGFDGSLSFDFSTRR